MPNIFRILFRFTSNIHPTLLNHQLICTYQNLRQIYVNYRLEYNEPLVWNNITLNIIQTFTCSIHVQIQSEILFNF